jgi:ZIP family zinc transporter
MASSLLQVVSFAAFPAAAMVVGGLAASARAPGPRLRSAVQHLAAGILFAALAAELLPDLMHRRLPWVTLAGFTAGIFAMLTLKELARRMESSVQDPGQEKFPTSLLVIAGVDILLDGLLIGISFTASARQGVLITVALTLEVLFLGVAVAAALSGPRARRQALVMSTLFGCLLLLGAVCGAYFLADASANLVDAVLAFAVAALLYLVTEELLTEAHEVKETAWLTLMFFAGFIVLLLIEMLI